MKSENFVLLCIVAAFVLWTTEAKFVYPPARRDKDICYTWHEKEEIKDPYQWLEKNTTETRKFMDDQNEFTESFLNEGNLRSTVKEKLINIYKRSDIGLPKKYGKYYFTFRNTGLQNHRVLYKQTDINKNPDVVLDPNKFSNDNSISLGMHGVSLDGNLIAYGTIQQGSEWNTVKVRNVTTLKDNPGEELRYVRYSSISWMPDHKGFFYSGYTEEAFKSNKSENHTLFYHRIGQTQDKDVPIFTHPNPLWRVQSQVSIDGKYLVIQLWCDSTKNALFIGELPVDGEIKDRIICKPIVPDLQSNQNYVANIGPKFFFRTNQNARNNRLVTFDFNTFEENQKFTDFIAENPREFMVCAYSFNEDKLVLLYGRSMQNTFDIRYLSNGTLIRSIPIEEGIFEALSVQYSNSEIFYSVNNALPPETTYRYDFSRPDEKPNKLQEKKWHGFDESQYVVKRDEYYSEDGTKIDLFIIGKKDMNGPKPCLLSGYGGFGLVNAPKLNPFFVYFLNEFDGFVAIALVRGEGIRPGWHDRGRKLNKQNSFTDFQYAAQHLVFKGYTEPKLTVINGVSHGGLLVATCVNQAPELFGVAIAEVAAMDMLRYPKFYLGHAYVEEFGNPQNETEFYVLRKYSPLHNIRKDKQYPPFLMLAGENDERAVPCHSMKFAAELQYDNEAQTNPILLRVYKGVGHGHGKSISQSIDENTDKLTFIHKVLKHKVLNVGKQSVEKTRKRKRIN